jgi:Cu2+-exporting ATPase
VGARFCCDGCAAVRELLEGAGLERYYELRGDGPAPRPAQTARASSMPAFVELLGERVRSSNGLVRVQADLQGLHCAACVWLVERLFERREGARSIVVNPARGTVDLCVAPTFAMAEFASDLAACGYVLGPLGEGKTRATSDLPLRMGIAIALAMNTMIFAISRYAGLGDDLVGRFFDALAFALAAASVAVGGPPFFRATIEAARRGALHLDAPISLGIVAAFVSSAVAFARGEGGAVYFDTLTVFVALMLVGRWLRQRAVERARGLLLDTDGALGLLVRVLDGAAPRIVPAAEVRKGDTLLLVPGDVLPLSVELTSPAAELSLSWITGESRPVAFAAGDTLPAGGFVAGESPVKARSLESFETSSLRTLLSVTDRSSARAPLVGLWHRLGTYYVATVLAVALVAGLGWWLATGDAHRTGDVLTSLFIVTCPCALGIAVPLAYDVFHAELRRLGVFVRSDDLLDRAVGLRRVVFDKTGTLTTGRLRLANAAPLDALEPAARRALAWLAFASNHPKASAVLVALRDRGETPEGEPPGELVEVAGRGVELRAPSGTFRLGRGDFAAGLPADRFALGLDGAPLAELELVEELRAGARAELDRLRARGLDVWVLSGDAAPRVHALAERAGVPPSQAEGDLSPSDKAERLGALGADEALYVGDGINDAPAFRAARCSGTPAIDRPFVPARTDFFFVRPGLEAVGAVLEAAALHRQTVRRVLAVAFAYNAATIALAAAGRLSPLLCAVLMPASSLAAIATVLHGARRARAALAAVGQQSAEAQACRPTPEARAA